MNKGIPVLWFCLRFTWKALLCMLLLVHCLIDPNQLYSHVHTHICVVSNRSRTIERIPAHWGRVTHICISKLVIIASDNGLSPGRRQAIIWTSVGIFLIKPLGTNFSEILIVIITLSFTKMRLKVSSAKWRLCCLGLNVLMIRHKWSTPIKWHLVPPSRHIHT